MTTYLFSIARRESDSENWTDLVSAVTRREFLARLKQDGLDPATADRWARLAARSVFAPADEFARGDRFEYLNAGPFRESYRVQAVAVTPPSLTTDAEVSA